MDIINRYVTEVGKHLPRKNRLDIEAELRSTLEDMLEDRSQQTGRPADEALASKLLKKYGAPKEVAAKYATHPYLIGPRMFPFYTFVLKIVLFAVTLGLSIATIVALINANMTGPEMLQSLVDFAVSLVSALVAAFGNVTLVFAILERFVPVAEFDEKETWTPDELTKEPDPDQVKVGDMIASIAFTVAALVIFNLYPQIVGIWIIKNEAWIQIAGLSEVFFRYLPWINLSGILTIALDVWLLRQGIWSTLTRWLHIGLQVIGIAIAAAMLSGPSLLAFYSTTIGAEAQNVMTRMFGLMVPIVLIIVIVGSAVEIVKDVVRMARPNKIADPFGKRS
jgi:hypothetical protein